MHINGPTIVGAIVIALVAVLVYAVFFQGAH